jgi:hypothetical protein
VSEAPREVLYDRGGAPTTELARARWWKENFAKIGPAMVAEAKRIEDSPSERGRRRASLVFARMHTGRPLSSLYDYGSAFRLAPSFGADPWGFGWKLPLNVVQAVVEAISAKLAKNKPRPLILTEGGNWTLQRQAKGLTQYLDGLHRATGLYKIGRRIFRDSGVFGTGVFHLYEDRQKGTIGVDRSLPIETIVDDLEASRGAPQTKYRKVPVYRGVLLDRFGNRSPETRALIEAAKGYNPAGNTDGRMSEMIPTYEGWKLGDSHTIGIAEGTLFTEEWEFDWFPDVAHHWRQPDSGVWGLGAAENLLGLQYEINQMLARFQANMKLGAKLWVFRDPSGGPQKAQMSNEAMTILDAEKPPTFATPNPMPAQAYQYLWDLYAKAFEIEGVSQLSATGTKPAGLDAAVALREFNDIQTERFVLMGQDWEDVHIEIAEKEIALSKRMYKRGKSIVVRAPGTKFIKTIEFEKVNLPENRYTAGIFPTSSLPTTPAARMQTIKEWFEAGLIPDRETALSLLDFPDLDAALSLELAAIEDIKRVLEKIVDDGQYEPPEPYMNITLALRMTQSAYLRARGDGVPEKRRAYLLQFIDDLRDLQADAQPPPAPAQAPAQPPAIGGPPSAIAGPGGAGMALPAMTASAAVPSELPA